MRVRYFVGRHLVFVRDQCQKVITINNYYFVVDDCGMHNTYCKVGCGSLEITPG
jgi:hypothetical protein